MKDSNQKNVEGVYLSYVGDGLCMGFHSTKFVQIDCGDSITFKNAGIDGFMGMRRMCKFFNDTPSIFILSHFHYDHYNGLLFLSNNYNKCQNYLPNKIKIENVYYPGIPEKQETAKKFLRCLFSMNLMLLGANKTTDVIYDFLSAILKINSYKSFSKRACFQGNKIPINGSKFKVVWPPKRDKFISENIKKAIDDFRRAMDENEKLKELYESVKIDKEIIERYFEKNKDNKLESKQKENKNHTSPVFVKEELSPTVKKANESLRKAANSLSLVFFKENRLLFMGDVENNQIKQIVEYLLSNENEYKKFDILITPHHGTHWDESLTKIKWEYALTSNGPERNKKLQNKFNSLSKKHLSTYEKGDICCSDFCKSYLNREKINRFNAVLQL